MPSWLRPDQIEKMKACGAIPSFLTVGHRARGRRRREAVGAGAGRRGDGDADVPPGRAALHLLARRAGLAAAVDPGARRRGREPALRQRAR